MYIEDNYGNKLREESAYCWSLLRKLNFCYQHP